MFIPIYSMILLGLFLVFCLYALKILQKNNDDTRRQTIDRLSKAYGQKYLNLDFLENQGKTSWYAAYATTNSIRGVRSEV